MIPDWFSKEAVHRELYFTTRNTTLVLTFQLFNFSVFQGADNNPTE